MDQAIVTRIYQINIPGIDDHIKKMLTLATTIGTVDTAKRKLNEAFAVALKSGNDAEVDRLRIQIDALNKQIANLQGQLAEAQRSATQPTTIGGGSADNLGNEKDALKQAGQEVSDFDKIQADALKTSTQFGDANKAAADDVKESAGTIAGTKVSFDQYTGSLRDNIKSHIENSTALAVNKAQQKEIESAIRSSGSATVEQTEKLAALKQESVVLNETNKQLSTTIRNQAKDFISSQGSVDEMRAKVNLLQQSYSRLSEAERATPFGQSIKAEIDILEPRVKQLEGTMGLYGRNVGNYSSALTGYANTLRGLRGPTKLVGEALGFGAQEADQFRLIIEHSFQALAAFFRGKEAKAEKEQAGAAATAASTAATEADTEATAANTAANETNVTTRSKRQRFAIDGPRLFIEEAAAMETSTGATQLATIAQEELAVATTATSTALKVFRTVALVSGIGILVGIIALVVSKMIEYRRATEQARLAQQDMAKALESSDYSHAIENFNELTKNVDLAKRGFLDKDAVIKQYNESIGKTIGQVTSLNEVETNLVDKGPAYLQMMLLKAAAHIALEEAAKKSYEAEQLRQKQLTDFVTIGNDVTTALAFGGDQQGIGTDNDPNKLRLEKAKKNQEEQVRITQEGSKKQLDIFQSFQEQAAKLAKDKGLNLLGDAKSGIDKLKEDLKKVIDQISITPANDPQLKVLEAKRDILKKQIQQLEGNSGKTGADKLSVDDQNEIKRIETKRDKQLAIENLKVAKLRELRKLTLDEETAHLLKLEQINDDADQKKIARVKGSNAAEIKERAQLELAIVDRKSQTVKAIQDLNEKEFSSESSNLKKQFEATNSKIDLGSSLVESNPTLSEEQKASTKKKADDLTLEAAEIYYDELLKLAKKYKVDDQEIESQREKAIADLKRKSSKDDIEISKAHLEDIKKDGENQVTKIESNYSVIRKKILDNEKLSASKKKDLIDQLDNAEKRTILSTELKTLNDQVDYAKTLLDQHLINQEEYDKKVKERNDKAAEQSKFTVDTSFSSKSAGVPGQTNLLDLIKGQTKGKFSIGKDKEGNKVDGSELLGNVIAQSYSVAQEAMQGYFDAEEARIEANKQHTYDLIDAETQQRTRYAQSQAEIDSINAQATQKKKDADKEAGEELKKVKKSEAKIALATELANIGVAAAANPLNGITLGAAGIAMYGILAALALARYAINVKNIDAQQFAGGGKVQTSPVLKIINSAYKFFGGGKVQNVEPLKNGKITVAQNIPVQPSGDRVLATVKPGEVLLNEEQQRKLGGASTFKAIGVPGFASGGLAGTYLAQPLGALGLGDNLQPPVNPRSFLSPAGGADLSNIEKAVAQQTDNINEMGRQIHQRIDNIKVQVVATEVQKTNDDIKKATAIATLK